MRSVVGPHTQDVDDAFVGEHLIDQAVLDVDAPGVAPDEVADQFLVSRRGDDGVLSGSASSCSPVALAGSCVDPLGDVPGGSTRSDLAPTPGTASWIACQSSSPMSTALPGAR